MRTPLSLSTLLYADDIEEGHDRIRWLPFRPPSVDQMVEATRCFHAGSRYIQLIESCKCLRLGWQLQKQSQI